MNSSKIIEKGLVVALLVAACSLLVIYFWIMTAQEWALPGSERANTQGKQSVAPGDKPDASTQGHKEAPNRRQIVGDETRADGRAILVVKSIRKRSKAVVSGYEVSLTTETRYVPPDLEWRPTNGDGVARWDEVPIGRYVVRGRLGALKHVSLSAGRNTVVLELEEDTLEVDVVDELNRPVSGSSIWLSHWTGVPDAGGIVARTDDRGHHTLVGNLENRFVSACSPEYGMARPVKIAGLHSLIIRLSIKGGVVRGRIIDKSGTPVPGAHVVFGLTNRGIPAPGVPYAPVETSSDSDGFYRAENIPAIGNVPVWVVPKEHAPLCDTVSILESDRELERDFVVGTGGTVHGVFVPLKQDGALLLFARILVDSPRHARSWHGPSSLNRTVRVTGWGEYRIEHVPKGRVRLGAVINERFQGNTEVDLTEARVVRHDIVESSDLLQRVRVETEDGIGLAGVHVDAIGLRSSGIRVRGVADKWGEVKIAIPRFAEALLCIVSMQRVEFPLIIASPKRSSGTWVVQVPSTRMRFGSINVDVPNDTRVEIIDVFTGERRRLDGSPTRRIERAPAGEYIVQALRKDGTSLPVWSVRMVVVPGAVGRVVVPSSPRSGTLHVSVGTSQAQRSMVGLYAHGSDRRALVPIADKTELTQVLYPGRYTVWLERNGVLQDCKIVAVADGGSVRCRLRAGTALPREINIELHIPQDIVPARIVAKDQSGAVVALLYDGHLRQNTVKTTQGLKPGTYSIVVCRRGRECGSGKLVVAEQRDVSVSIRAGRSLKRR